VKIGKALLQQAICGNKHSLIPLRRGPLKQARGFGEGCELPSGVCGGAPAEIEFGAF